MRIREDWEQPTAEELEAEFYDILNSIEMDMSYLVSSDKASGLTIKEVWVKGDNKINVFYPPSDAFSIDLVSVTPRTEKEVALLKTAKVEDDVFDVNDFEDIDVQTHPKDDITGVEFEVVELNEDSDDFSEALLSITNESYADFLNENGYSEESQNIIFTGKLLTEFY